HGPAGHTCKSSRYSRGTLTKYVNGKTYFRLAWKHRHALSLFGTAPRARVRPKHSSPIDPVRHQHQTFIATECIPFPISGSRCRDTFHFLSQAADAEMHSFSYSRQQMQDI